MTAGAGRVERLDKSAEQLHTPADDDNDDGQEQELYFPEERTHMRNNISTKYLHRNRVEAEDSSSYTTERTRFQRISVATSYTSSHEATSPKSVVFRTRF